VGPGNARQQFLGGTAFPVTLATVFTVSDRAFPVACAWNGLPQHVTSAPSLPVARAFWRPSFSHCLFSWPHSAGRHVGPLESVVRCTALHWEPVNDIGDWYCK